MAAKFTVLLLLAEDPALGEFECLNTDLERSFTSLCNLSICCLRVKKFSSANKFLLNVLKKI